MRAMLISVIGCFVCLFLVAACGDSNDAAGSGGSGLLCASDQSNVGQTIDCPGGTQKIDFCFDSGTGDCFYVVGGEQISCGSCIDGGNDLTECAAEAAERCD